MELQDKLIGMSSSIAVCECLQLHILILLEGVKKLRRATYTAAVCKFRGDIFFGLVLSVA